MIYISGKITGTDDYLERFEAAENHLNNSDILDVINPAKVNSFLPELSYSQYIKMSLCMLDNLYVKRLGRQRWSKIRMGIFKSK